MADGMVAQGDPTLDADEETSEAVSSGADGLSDFHDDLSRMRRRRGRRLVVATDPLGRGSGKLALHGGPRSSRVLPAPSESSGRWLADALRSEGMSVTYIAALLDVSRQRVSALVRPRRTT